MKVDIYPKRFKSIGLETIHSENRIGIFKEIDFVVYKEDDKIDGSQGFILMNGR